MEVPREDHPISPAGIQDTLRSRFASEMCGGVQGERGHGKSMFWVGDGMGARNMGKDDRFERDEQRDYRPQVSDTEGR